MSVVRISDSTKIIVTDVKSDLLQACLYGLRVSACAESSGASYSCVHAQQFT